MREGGVSLAEWYGIDEVYMIAESIPEVIAEFDDVFQWPEELP